MLKRVIALLCCLQAAPLMATTQRLAIIIDDLGNSRSDRQVLDLRGAFTLSILPHTPYAKSLAEKANAQGKEVMLHLPMESTRDNRLGPAALTSAMPQRDFQQVIHQALAELPFVRGVNNHMGSHLTTLVDPMAWTMQVLREYPVYFVDSRTSVHTLAEQTATKHGVPALRRHVFLDTRADSAFVARQIERLIRLAKQGKQPLAIGHPYPETLVQLNQLLARLEQEQIELVPVSALLSTRQRDNLAQVAEGAIRALH